MATYEKNYIGKGTQVQGMEIAKVTLKVSEMLKFVHKFEGEDYITFEVSKMQHPDQFGRDYTVYCVTKDQDETPAPEKKKRAKKEKLPA
jgi:hypothetical protein